MTTKLFSESHWRILGEEFTGSGFTALPAGAEVQEAARQRAAVVVQEAARRRAAVVEAAAEAARALQAPRPTARAV